MGLEGGGDGLDMSVLDALRLIETGFLPNLRCSKEVFS